jgi:hypothetical protein
VNDFRLVRFVSRTAGIRDREVLHFGAGWPRQVGDRMTTKRLVLRQAETLQTEGSIPSGHTYL